MYKREEYIKNITSGLARIQSELNLLNPINLYDIDIISEDFFAGLLNLVYGFEFQNDNHEKKNAKAIDLSDKKNRITVQVTHDNDRDKIQKTIDKYIECRLYDDYDRLIFFLLRDKKNYTKEFDTKKLLNFDIRNDIIDVTDLIRKISSLDTEMLRAVDAYCAAEIGGYRQRNKKRNNILCGIGAAFLLILIIFLRFKYTPVAKVYASDIYPYTNAGSYYSSYEEFPKLYKNEIETNKAFAIMSSIRSYGEKVSSVEQIYCEILSLEPIGEADIRLDAVIIDDILYLFAFNNGWGNADTPIVKSAKLKGENINIEMVEFSKSIDYAESTEIKTAGAILIAKFVLDSEALQHYYEEYKLQILELYIRAEGNDYDCDFWAYLAWREKGFCLEYGGMGGSGYRVTLLAVLDVDRNPSVIHFTGENATPFIEDILQVETVLAPTKSCIVKCRNVFSVNGKFQQTDVYTAKVTVPVFTDAAIGLSGLLTQELAQLQNLDEVSIERTVQKYLYKAESIKDNSSDEY